MVGISLNKMYRYGVRTITGLKSKKMKRILLITIILVSSCKSNKETIANRQQAIQQEMQQVKAAYYKKADSLNMLKEADTSSVKQVAIAEELVSADRERSAVLLSLQMEYDSLENVVKKY